MRIRIKVYIRGKAEWAEPVRCRIEIRDAGLMDAPAEVIASHEVMIRRISEGDPCNATIILPDEKAANRILEIWGHISLTGSGRIHPGDFITTISYPVPKNLSGGYIPVELKKV
jgi:hypothetical protein